MWLINTSTRKLEHFADERNVAYAILSHTWGEEEVTFQDMHQSRASGKLGYTKIAHTCDQAIKDGANFAWVDTCCINKESSAELSEAINSSTDIDSVNGEGSGAFANHSIRSPVYRWYGAAKMCYAFLSDVAAFSPQPTEQAFTSSRWFSRGWTLQELIAPKEVTFFGEGWSFIGTRSDLAGQISTRTGISLSAFNGRPVERFNIATKMRWAAHRETSRVEDRAYCLLGLFGINMPLLYGEAEKAFQRLQEEIIRTTTDHSVFCWSYEESNETIADLDESDIDDVGSDESDEGDLCDISEAEARRQIANIQQADPGLARSGRGDSMLASCPEDFARFPEEVKNWTPQDEVGSFQLSNSGLEINLPIIRPDRGMLRSVLAVINCRTVTNLDGPLALRLRPRDQEWQEHARPMFTVDKSDIPLLSGQISTRRAGNRLQHVLLADAENAERVHCTILQRSPGHFETTGEFETDSKLKVLVRPPSVKSYISHRAWPADSWHNGNLFIPTETLHHPRGAISWRSLASPKVKLGMVFSYPEGQLGFRLAILRAADTDLDVFDTTKAAAEIDCRLEELLEGGSKAVTTTFWDGVEVSARGRVTRLMEEWIFLVDMQERDLALGPVATELIPDPGDVNFFREAPGSGEQSIKVSESEGNSAAGFKKTKTVSFAKEPPKMEQSPRKPSLRRGAFTHAV